VKISEYEDLNSALHIYITTFLLEKESKMLYQANYLYQIQQLTYMNSYLLIYINILSKILHNF